MKESRDWTNRDRCALTVGEQRQTASQGLGSQSGRAPHTSAEKSKHRTAPLGSSKTH